MKRSQPICEGIDFRVLSRHESLNSYFKKGYLKKYLDSKDLDHGIIPKLQ